jgi:hypothetical protein
VNYTEDQIAEVRNILGALVEELSDQQISNMLDIMQACDFNKDLFDKVVS